jgi:molecular chaperone DnaK
MSTPDQPPSSQPPVGIDLGTTFSVIANLDATGRPVTIRNHLGDLLTPSSLFFDDDGVIVGKEAVRSAALAPDRYTECFKRDMGSPYSRRKIRGHDVPPEVLSAFVLEQLKKDAEQKLTSEVRRVVITVPAFFDETRRKATQEAGQLADLEVLDIINEPTAAALAYGYAQGFLGLDPAEAAAQPRKVMVYDLGGGTFDVTILELHGTRFRALATDGDVWLGGKDFDERLVNYLAEQFIATHGVDPRSDAQDAAQLWLDAAEVKHALSERTKTTAVCFHAGIRMRIEVTREKFEELTRDLVERTETTTSLVVKQAGLEWHDIDRALLVGGSSRMPMVSHMLQRLTGKMPDCSQSPDEAVAHGAALYAGMLMGQKRTGPACQLINVNSHSLGVVGLHQKTRQVTNVVLIPKNTPLPARAVRVFKTARANQRSVKVAVVEGESHRPEDCIALGECIVRDLPPGLAQGTPVEVEYAYAANGRLSVAARIPSIRYSRHVEIDRDQARHLGDLKTWRERLRGAVDAGVETFAAEPATVNLADRTSVLRRLDGLYVLVGRHAVRMTLPDALARSQHAALEAVSALSCAQANVKDAERLRQAAQDSTESPRADARLSQTRTELQQSQIRCDFALLVLGRDCAAAGYYPSGLESETQEIQRLRKHLEGPAA